MRAINRHLFVRISVAACVLAVAAAVVGCSSSTDEDKAGVETRDEPVELVLANHDDSSEAVGAWAEAVERLSGGSIRIRVSNSWRQGESNYEQATLKDAGRGEVDLAIVAARAYDEVGVTSFQPLVAPMLIDSSEVERRVLRDGDVTGRALAGAEKLGLTGLALLPTELRRPVGLTRTLAAPADYEGARVYAREGKTARATFEALGARAVHLPIEQWSKSVDGAEVGLAALRGRPELARGGARMTANVVLWPQPMTIVMNQDAFDELSESQQTALRDAVERAFDRESRLVSMLAEEDLVALCRIGTEFVEATPSQVAALRTAVEPVYQMIERGPGNADAIARIRELKGEAQPETLACVTDQTAPADTGDDAPELEGTYRTTLSEKELAESPLLSDEAEVNDENWGELTLRLSDGRVRYAQQNDRGEFAASGTYTTDGDVIKLHFDDLAETWGFRWSLYRGTLKLERDESLGTPPELHAPTSLLVKPWRRVR
jgi:TRAP-type C4-dicarboxylate transport system substrate-binding protein